MKKKNILILLIILSCLCTGCDFDKLIHGEVDFEDHPTYINVVVSGVDDGILHCKYVCEWEDSYAYYDQGVIYYFENSESKPYEIECPKLTYMDMNERYIYYTQGTGLKVFDKECKYSTEIIDIGEITSIDISSESVVVNCDYTIFYEMDGTDIDKQAIAKYPQIFISSKNMCANIYNYSKVYVYSDKGIYRIRGGGYDITDQKGKEGEFYEFEGKNMGPYTSPELTSWYNGKIYVLQQATFATGNVGLNMNYNHKEWDQLICFDPITQKSESIYKTVGPEEQLVNFSIENKELYLLIKGKLYKSNLKGQNKKELADLSGIAPTLSFDYVNDTLFVYDGDKLLGQYK